MMVTALETLKSSIKDGGQQVPHLSAGQGIPGSIEIIYGRRRLRAC
jgi:ParB family chromosome partitioning protein